MRKEGRPPRYAKRVVAVGAKALAEGRLRPGGLYVTDVAHDDWCDLLAGKGQCNCNPSVSAPREVTKEELIQSTLAMLKAIPSPSPATAANT
jgi:hypothetical protein